MMIFAAAFSVNAAAIQQTTVVEQQEKEKINPEDLPEAVQSALKGDSYQEWSISEAYFIKSSEQYEVQLKKDEETKTVKFDKDGKVVD